ncbi:hypothetical protein F383_32584 [Gossypium arboreum]|uniref:Uncharacterized protein n=1 Tax=Gossypium arboreum TaxID=29729 RepID=A0A0B0PN46_GOSAR|nr:hypothetical protein F383_32584 [Gossypium arboreum]
MRISSKLEKFGIFRLRVDETLYVSTTVTAPDSFRRGTLYLTMTVNATVTITLRCIPVSADETLYVIPGV